MKNNEIKLIATDMDGTFLNDQHQYDQDLLRKVLACLLYTSDAADD